MYEVYVPHRVNPCGKCRTIGEAALMLCDMLAVSKTGFVILNDTIVFQFTKPPFQLPVPIMPGWYPPLNQMNQTTYMGAGGACL